MRDCQLEDLPPSIRDPTRVFVPTSLEVGNVEDVVELELAVLDLLDRELRQGRIAILVEAPGTEDALIVLGGIDLLYHLVAIDLAIFAGPLDGVEHDVGRLV